jgi:predicted transcriptional regulator
MYVVEPVGVTVRARGGLEQEVLAVLAAAGHPMTPAQVRDAVGGELAYTTVMTVLTLLFEKGRLIREPTGRAYAYTMVADDAQVTAWQMQRLLGERDDRAQVLARFVGTLSAHDERLLADLLRSDDDNAHGDDTR